MGPVQYTVGVTRLIRPHARSGHKRLRPSQTHICCAPTSSTGSTAEAEVAALQSLELHTQSIHCVGTASDVSCVNLDWEDAATVPVNGPLPSYTREELASEHLAVVDSELSDDRGNMNIIQEAGSLLLLISPFFFWGSSMVAMKVLGPHTSPIFVGAFRLVPAGAALLTWAHMSGRRAPSGWQAWLAIAVFALFDGALFQGCLAEGLQRTSAGLGSIIIDSQPITVALLASLFFGERLKALGYGGLALGVLGLLLLEVPVDLLSTGSLPTAELLSAALPAGSSLWDNGEWWMLLAAQSMAVGTVLVPWVCRYADPVVATGWHLVLGGLPLAALSYWQELPQLQERLPLLTGSDIGLLLYVSLLGSAASYGVFFYNASRGNLTALSSLTFLTPCFAAAIGYLLLGETLTPLQLAGGALTLAAVTLVNQNHEAPAKEDSKQS